MKIAWISSFPIEWLPNVPAPFARLPRSHPSTWQRVLLEELKLRPELKFDVIAVRTSFPRNGTFDWQGVTFHCLKVPKGLRTLSLFWVETFLIRKCLKAIGPDLVHAWGSERGAALVASRLGYPYLVTLQGLLEWYSQQVKMNMYHRLDAQLERIALRRAPVVTTESKFAVRWLQDHYPRLEVRQAEHAPNWLFHHIERRPQTKPVQFIFIGIMGFIKGTDLLLRALDQLKHEFDFRLVIVGFAPAEFLQRLQACTSAELWSRIVIRQNLMPSQVAEELARATMLLFPTRADTSPNAVKEAVVAGVPVVASAVGGIVDYVLPGRNGIIFPPDSLQEIIKAIRAALAHPLFNQGNVEQNVLKQMRDYLSPRLMADRFLAAYQRAKNSSLANDNRRFLDRFTRDDSRQTRSR